MLQGTDVIDAKERRNFIFFFDPGRGFSQARNKFVLLLILTIPVAGCGGKKAPPPRGYADGHGGWCEPDLSSARRLGGEAIFSHLCEFTADSDRNKLVGKTSNGLLQGVSTTRRFNCENRRLVEVTNTLYWERAPSETIDNPVDRMVLPNSPVESALDFACSDK